jgi:hypothetical protein
MTDLQHAIAQETHREWEVYATAQRREAELAAAASAAQVRRAEQTARAVVNDAAAAARQAEEAAVAARAALLQPDAATQAKAATLKRLGTWILHGSGICDANRPLRRRAPTDTEARVLPSDRNFYPTQPDPNFILDDGEPVVYVQYIDSDGRPRRVRTRCTKVCLATTTQSQRSFGLPAAAMPVATPCAPTTEPVAYADGTATAVAMPGSPAGCGESSWLEACRAGRALPPLDEHRAMRPGARELRRRNLAEQREQAISSTVPSHDPLSNADDAAHNKLIQCAPFPPPINVHRADYRRYPTLHEQGIGGEFSHQVEKDGASISVDAFVGEDLLMDPRPPVHRRISVNPAPERGSWQTRCRTFCTKNGLSVDHTRTNAKKDLLVAIFHTTNRLGHAIGHDCFGGDAARTNSNVEYVYEFALAVAQCAIEVGLCPPPTLRVASLLLVPWTSLAARGLYTAIDLTPLNDVESRVGRVAQALGGARIVAAGVDGEGQGWCTCGTCPTPRRTRCQITHVQIGLLLEGHGGPLVICDYTDSMLQWSPLLLARLEPRTLIAIWGGDGLDDDLAIRLFNRRPVDLQRQSFFVSHLRSRLPPASRSSQPLSLKWAMHSLIAPTAERPDAPYQKHSHLHDYDDHFGAWQRASRHKMTAEHKAYGQVDGFAVAKLAAEFLRWQKPREEALRLTATREVHWGYSASSWSEQVLAEGAGSSSSPAVASSSSSPAYSPESSPILAPEPCGAEPDTDGPGSTTTSVNLTNAIETNTPDNVAGGFTWDLPGYKVDFPDDTSSVMVTNPDGQTTSGLTGEQALRLLTNDMVRRGGILEDRSDPGTVANITQIDSLTGFFAAQGLLSPEDAASRGWLRLGPTGKLARRW